jgi:outer membrane lipoprotein carrier protein
MTDKGLAGVKRTLRAVFLLVLFIASVAGTSGYAQTVQDVVASVEKHYGASIDLTAQVVQKNILTSIDRTQKFEGLLWIKKPGKLRLDYTNGQVILVDGKSALFYSAKSKQMIRKAFADVQQMNIPVTFLLGAAHIQDDFDVLQPDPKMPRVLELLPKKTGAAMKKLRIQVDEAGHITTLAIFDRSDNRTEITFTDIREGVGLDDQRFVFKTPKGTEIIDQ